MSYILEAIAKSEAERQQQDMPRAEALALPTATSPGPRRTWLYLIAGALLLNALLLAIWIRSDPTAPVPSNAPGAAVSPETNAKSEDEASATVTHDSTSTQKTATGANDVPLVAVTDIQPDTGIVDPGKSPVSKVSAGRRQDAPPSTSTPRPVDHNVSGQIARTDDALLPPVETGDADTRNTNRADTAASAAAVIADTDTAWRRIEPDSLSKAIGTVRQQVAAPDDDSLFYKISRLGDLPDAVRKDLPTVAFSGHLYSSNPQSSLVFVGDGSPVITGQQIAEDLFLHEITPGGVVVEFRGYLIEVGVLQNWKLN